MPQLWGASSLRGGVFDEGASLLVWRDSGQVQEPFACASSPETFPLDQGISLYFDEQGRDVLVPRFALGLEAQKRSVDWEGPFFGWISLNLEAGRTETPYPPPQQSFVTSLEQAGFRFGLSISGVQLPNVIFTDGFENGNFVMWSSQAP